MIVGPFKVLQDLRDGRKVIDEVKAKELKDQKDSPKATTKKKPKADGAGEEFDDEEVAG